MRNGEILTDIHAHVLPGLDDGPIDLEVAQALLEAFKAGGVERVFCTSHYMSPSFDVSREAMQNAYEDLQKWRNGYLADGSIGGDASPSALDDCRNDAESFFQETAAGVTTVTESAVESLTLHDEQSRGPLGSNSHDSAVTPNLALGAEVRMTHSFVENLRNNDVPTLGNTSYVLLEFPGNVWDEKLFAFVHELKVRGYRPIMAHPERVIPIQKNSRLVDELLEMGLLLQLTAQCFVDVHRDSPSNRLAWGILSQGKATVIASDAHHPRTRPPQLRGAYENIQNRLGESVVNQLIANANAIWMNEPCEPVRVEQQSKRGGLWSKLMRR